MTGTSGILLALTLAAAWLTLGWLLGQRAGYRQCTRDRDLADEQRWRHYWLGTPLVPAQRESGRRS